MNNKWPSGGHVFFNRAQPFLNSSKICPNFMKIMSSRLFTCFHYIHIKKTAPLPGAHVFPLITTIFKLIRDIHITNIQTIFELKCRIQVCGHVFLPIQTIFELNCHIQKTHVLTKFHEHCTKNVTSRVFPCFHYIHIEKTAPPPGGHVFSPIWTIFELVRDINETNFLTKFHDDWAKIVTSRVSTRNTAPPPGSHLHEDWASNVTSTVFTSFELSQGINGTNVLTKFHEDQTINVASRVVTRQNADDARRTTHNGQKAITKAHHEQVVLR
ncbi:hypothetical protein DPMN_104257 [Dreissena polymorpha]|uniref:Uncharacterized protein n=1 Tax=Dreissena polymorpha TaxID=45954 RepID=A0A9D4HBM8_DREPO|nr:hypothetical protein DPMN_104257 [Dreissena polymorpha]